MATVSYYRDGIPYSSNGSPIITITGGNTPIGPAMGTNPNAPSPVFVNWPGSPSNIPRGGGHIEYDPHHLNFAGLSNLRSGQKAVTELVDKALKNYPSNVLQVQKNAKDLIEEIKKEDALDDPSLKPYVEPLQTALASLDIHLSNKSAAEKKVKESTTNAEKAYIDFMNNNKLGNFIGKRDDMIDVAIQTSISALHRIWDREVTPKFSDDIKNKNDLVAILDRIKTITEDVESKRQRLSDVARRELQRIKENKALKDAVKFASDFFKELTEKLGEDASKISRMLASAASGKKIRNVDEALRAFERFGAAVNTKYSLADRKAIANALQSVNKASVAKSYALFSVAFKGTGKLIDGYDLFIVEVPKAIDSKNWRPVFVKVEALFAGAGATALVAFCYAFIAGTPLNIFLFALVMALTSAFIDDKMMELVNALIGI